MHFKQPHRLESPLSFTLTNSAKGHRETNKRHGCSRRLRCLKGPRTWHADVGQHRLLAVFDAADLREVDVQGQEGHAAQEGHGAHEDAVIASVLVLVENAVLLHLVGSVYVALVGDAAEDDDGEELQWEGKKKKKILTMVTASRARSTDSRLW